MSQFRFYHPIEVRYGDLDPQGHVNNAKYLTYFEQARVAYWIDMGFFTKDQSFMELGVILADVHITYFEPVYFGQEIKVGVHVTRLGNKSMTWEQNTNYTLAYKTGWGRTESGHHLGWVVGWLEEDGHPYFFVLNIESEKPDFDMVTVRKKMLIDILKYKGFLSARN